MKRLRLALLFMLSVTTVLHAGGAMSGELGGGDIIYSKPVKSVLFSHTLHVDERGLSCDLCHPKLFEMRALAAQERPDFTMKSLYAGKYCGACHDGNTAFASDSQCARCHGGVKEYEAALAKGKIDPAKPARGPDAFVYKPKGAGKVTFSHESHTQSFSCNDCHNGLFRVKKGGSKMTMDAMYAGGFCGKCHNGQTATNVMECAKCHAP